jgi:hypothetical protein
MGGEREQRSLGKAMTYGIFSSAGNLGACAVSVGEVSAM